MIDPSIALNQNRPAPPQPINMLAAAGQAATTADQVLRMQANKLIGQNVQTATDPTTGVVDTGALNVLNAQTPGAAYGAQASAAQSQALQQAQQTRGQQGQAQVNNLLAGFMTLPDSDMTLDGVKGVLDQGKATNSISPQDEQAVLNQIAATDGSPGAIRRIAMMHTVANLGGPEALAQVMGTLQTRNDGQTAQTGLVTGPLNPNATPGTFQPGSSMPIYPSRADLMSRTNTGVNGQGQPTQGPLGSVTPPGLTGPAGAGMAPGGAPSPLGNGRLPPPSLLNPNRTPPATPAGGGGYAPPLPPDAPAAPAGPAAPAVSPTGVVAAGNAPGVEAAATANAAASQAAFHDISAQGVQARSQNAILGNMLGDTANFASGETNANNFKTALQRQAPGIAHAFGIDSSSVAANESFDKLANQIAGQQGAGSDARLAVAQHGNPSSTLSQGGVDSILRQLQGNADYLQARAKVAAAYPDQMNSAKFEAEVGSQLDPRAFQFDRMTPDQRRTYAQSLSPTDRSTVQRAYQEAGRRGVLSSGWQPPAAPAAQPAAQPTLVVTPTQSASVRAY